MKEPDRLRDMPEMLYLIAAGLFVGSLILVALVLFARQPVSCDHVATVNKRPLCVIVNEVEQ